MLRRSNGQSYCGDCMGGKRLSIALICVAICVVSGFAALARPAGTRSQSEAEGWLGEQQDRFAPYCGLYALHNAMLVLGGKVEFSDLLKPQYIGSKQGSSADELIRAAKDHNYFAVPIAHLSCTALAAARAPMILHVRANPGEPEYNHWILFVGSEDGDAKIIDGRKAVMRLKYEELGALWDGLGIVVAASSESEWPVYAALILDGGLYLVVMAIVAIGIQAVYRRLSRSGQRMDDRHRFLGSLLECEFVAAAGIALLAFAKGVPPAGYFGATRVIQRVEDAHRVDLLSVTDSATSLSQQAAANGVIIDVRADRKQPIAGLPAGSDVRPIESNCAAAELDRLLKGLPLEQHLVVCCDRLKGCGSAQNVCDLLWSRGFRRIVIFRAH
jgi:hypothetical protein